MAHKSIRELTFYHRKETIKEFNDKNNDNSKGMVTISDVKAVT